MPTITATAYPAEAYVLVLADWSDVPAAEYARVIRTNTVTGEQVRLRPYGAYNSDGDLLLNCSRGLWWDTEPPLGVPLTYRTEAADVQANLVTNSGFETGTVPWVASGGVLTQSGVFFKAGTFSGLVTPTGADFSAEIRQTAIPVAPNVPATLSGWVLSPQGWNAVRLQVQWLNSGGIQTGATVTTPVEIVDDGEWRWMTVTATPPADAVTATVTAQASGLPPNTTLFYWDELELSQVLAVPNTVTSTPVTVAATSPYYLKDPMNPCHDLVLARCMPGPRTGCDPTPAMMVLDYGPRDTYPSRGRELDASTQAAPIPIARRRGTPENILTIITRTFADRDTALEIFDPGTVLLFQAPPEYGIPDRYIDVHDVAVDAPVRDRKVQPRLFTIPHKVVNRTDDAANGVCGARIDDLCDTWGTWAAIAIAGLTWRDLLLGLASPAGPGQPPLSGLRTFDQVNAEFADFNAVDNGVRTFTGLLNGL